MIDDAWHRLSLAATHQGPVSLSSGIPLLTRSPVNLRRVDWGRRRGPVHTIPPQHFSDSVKFFHLVLAFYPFCVALLAILFSQIPFCKISMIKRYPEQSSTSTTTLYLMVARSQVCCPQRATTRKSICPPIISRATLVLTASGYSGRVTGRPLTYFRPALTRDQVQAD